MAGYQRVAVGTDGSESSFRAVDRAAALAQDCGATLVIACAYLRKKPDLHTQDQLGDLAWQVTDSAIAEEHVATARSRAVAAGATTLETVTAEGRPADTLRTIVEDRGIDLLVVGNRGLNTLMGRIVGSVPMDVARHLPCDVLIVHTT